MPDIACAAAPAFLLRLAPCLALLLLGLGCSAPAPAPEPEPAPTGDVVAHRDQRVGPHLYSVQVGGQRAWVRLARDHASRLQGLAGVSALGPDEGMLFIYPRPRSLSYWMKGCLIPLDVAYLDRERRVVGVRTLPVPPPGSPDLAIPSFPSPGEVLMVLEMPGGWFQRHGVGVGDRLEIPEGMPHSATE